MEEFIGGARQARSVDDEDESSSSTESQDGQEVYPWEESHVREDVKTTYPLRLPEPLHLKLKYVSEQTGLSMNEICNRAVRDEVVNHLDEIEG